MRIRVAYIVLVHKRYSGLMYSQSENGIRSRYYNKRYLRTERVGAIR